MIKIYVKKQGNYPVSAPKIKKHLKLLLEKKGIVSDSLVNVSFVGEEKMRKLAKKYLRESSIHNVLSFPEAEVRGEFVYPQDNIIRLGEIVICYKKVVEEAKKEGKLIDKLVLELVEHAALHLLGEHHDSIPKIPPTKF